MLISIWLKIFASFAVAAPVQWTMVNVNSTSLQGDAHFVQFPNNRNILIDACGNQDALLEFLRRKKIKYLDQILISHMHKDHYGGILKLLENDIRVGQIRMTLPSEKTCRAEVPWGCDWEDVQSFLTTLRRLRIPVKGYKQSEVLYQEGSTLLKVIAAYPSHASPVGELDVNDTSAILKLNHGSTSALFTGDLNRKLGEWLATHSMELKADILKVPHHGTESTAPDSFFDAVKARFALVPSPASLWLGERSQRIRKYFTDKGIPTFVNGIDGNIKVILNSGSITIDPELESRVSALHYIKPLSE